MNRPFLTAEWRRLAMLNFTIDPAVLRPLIPTGTELDFFRGNAFVSVVGFEFLNTRVFGCAFPFHRNFQEVNLRFYVRCKCSEGWRRGVVFIRELVPRAAIALIARTFYGEPYLALPMRQSVQITSSRIAVEYSWRRAGKWESLRAAGEGDPQEIGDGSEEEFITEHYWGYTARGSGCSEYQVEHPRWRVWQAVEARLDADIAALYGEEFVESLSTQPASAFIADGSPVAVRYHAPLLPAQAEEQEIIA